MSLFELLTIPVVFILLMFSGFFSGSETALTAASRSRIHAREKEGVAAAARVSALKAEPERLIGSILLGNNVVNILATALLTAAMARFGPVGAAYATMIMTPLVLIFAEVLPKTYAFSNAERVAMAVSTPLQWIVRLLSPIVFAIQMVVRGTLKLFGVNTSGDALSAHEEIRGAINLHHSEGSVVKDDRDMLGGILDLRELEVSDIMIHRKNVEMLDIDGDPEELVREALNSRYTRLPIVRGDDDEIIGVLHAKDLSRALHDKGDARAVDISAIAREPWFVPDRTNVLDQLNAFREKREHFALVIDEYGALMGIVTLEDVIEEIVGEIEDEFDSPVEGLKQEADGSVIVDGHVPIRDLNRALDWDLPDEEAVTIAGLVIHEAKAIPEKGQKFAFFDRRFEILERRRNQVTRLRISPMSGELDGI